MKKTKRKKQPTPMHLMYAICFWGLTILMYLYGSDNNSEMGTVLKWGAIFMAFIFMGIIIVKDN